MITGLPFSLPLRFEAAMLCDEGGGDERLRRDLVAQALGPVVVVVGLAGGKARATPRRALCRPPSCC
jgi:hypothetical protein